eukprot:scaffold238995_cov24-Tisochrysis_lutea.AAC.1
MKGDAQSGLSLSLGSRSWPLHSVCNGRGILPSSSVCGRRFRRQRTRRRAEWRGRIEGAGPSPPIC